PLRSPQSLLTGLMYYRPDDPIDYLEGCLKKVRELGGTEKVRWDTFVGQERKSLPPLNGGHPNFPYRRYDRLPPISQFSIESDSDLSETAELIEEYEVFDPSRPRPKVILVIGGPGSGKGTQSLKIAERYGFQYMSVGELLRKKMIHNATSNRKWSLIAKIITNGELAPQVAEKRGQRRVGGGRFFVLYLLLKTNSERHLKQQRAGTFDKNSCSQD
uniref:Adenylate kinase 5 n=1 Tax=Poecilia latipinna TaxID=48699 RepID=A0A3B3V7C8_9TELE